MTPSDTLHAQTRDIIMLCHEGSCGLSMAYPDAWDIFLVYAYVPRHSRPHHELRFELS